MSNFLCVYWKAGSLNCFVKFQRLTPEEAVGQLRDVPSIARDENEETALDYAQQMRREEAAESEADTVGLKSCR